VKSKKTFIQKNDGQQYTLGIVYEPDVVDSQGDFAKEDVIEKAAWNFMKSIQAKAKLTTDVAKAFTAFVDAVKKGEGEVEITSILEAIRKDDNTGLGLQHAYWGDELGDIVESYIAPVDMQIGEQTITKGTWMMGVVWNPDVFAKVQDGSITGYSMGGSGTRLDSE
jgi:hypothetical protein